MIAVILDFLRQHWRSTLAASLFIMLCMQHMEIVHLHRTIAQNEAEKIALADSNKRLVASIQYQNASIVKLQTEALNKNRRAAKALAKARRAAEGYAHEAAHIKAQKTGGDTCADMITLLNDSYSKPF